MKTHIPIAALVAAASQIEVGVLSDIGFTKLPDLVDTAKVFTSTSPGCAGAHRRPLPRCARSRRPHSNHRLGYPARPADMNAGRLRRCW